MNVTYSETISFSNAPEKKKKKKERKENQLRIPLGVQAIINFYSFG